MESRLTFLTLLGKPSSETLISNVGDVFLFLIIFWGVLCLEKLNRVPMECGKQVLGIMDARRKFFKKLAKS